MKFISYSYYIYYDRTCQYEYEFIFIFIDKKYDSCIILLIMIFINFYDISKKGID